MTVQELRDTSFTQQLPPRTPIDPQHRKPRLWPSPFDRLSIATGRPAAGNGNGRRSETTQSGAVPRVRAVHAESDRDRDWGLDKVLGEHPHRSCSPLSSPDASSFPRLAASARSPIESLTSRRRREPRRCPFGRAGESVLASSSQTRSNARKSTAAWSSRRAVSASAEIIQSGSRSRLPSGPKTVTVPTYDREQ
jgi:hypothetical protein